MPSSDRIVLLGYDPRPKASLASPFDTYQGDRLAAVSGLNADRELLRETFECWNLVDPRKSRSTHAAHARWLIPTFRQRWVVLVGDAACDLVEVPRHPRLTWRRGEGFERLLVVPSPSRVNRTWPEYARDVGQALSSAVLLKARLTLQNASDITDVTDVTDITGGGDLLGYDEAAKLLGVSVEHLRVLVSRRQVPHVRLTARSVRFSKLALRLWIESRTVGPGEPDPV